MIFIVYIYIYIKFTYHVAAGLLKKPGGPRVGDPWAWAGQSRPEAFARPGQANNM